MPAIITDDDLDPATLSVVANKLVAQDPTKAPATITTSVQPATPVVTGDTVNTAVSKLQAQVSSGRYAQSVGNGTDLTYLITHNMGTTDVQVQVYVIATGASVFPGVTRVSNSQIQLEYTTPPAAGAHRVVVEA